METKLHLQPSPKSNYISNSFFFFFCSDDKKKMEAKTQALRVTSFPILFFFCSDDKKKKWKQKLKPYE